VAHHPKIPRVSIRRPWAAREIRPQRLAALNVKRQSPQEAARSLAYAFSRPGS
jgi:hypothetical protein